MTIIESSTDQTKVAVTREGDEIWVSLTLSDGRGAGVRLTPEEADRLSLALRAWSAP